MISFSEKSRIKIIDYFKKTNTYKYYKFFLSSLSWDRDQLESYKIERLKQLLRHCYQNVPFYKMRFDEVGFIPEELTCIADLKKIPPLTRDDLRDNADLLISSIADKKTISSHSSSGTTGIPIKYYHDSQSISAGTAALYNLYGLSGWKVGDRSIHIWGNPISIKSWNRYPSRIKRKLLNQKFFAASLLYDQKTLSKMSKAVIKYDPKFIDGYPSAIATFANWIKENNTHINKRKAIFTTGENLLEYQQRLIEEQLGPVSDLYGCGEVNGIAIRPIGDDRYFILEPHVILEVEENKHNFKELLITDLDNYSMSFIRYKIGDIVDNIYEPESDCIFPLSYFKRIDGRKSDIIKLPNGKIIIPISLLGGTSLRTIKSIKKHKVVWNGKKLIFHLEMAGPVNRSEIYKTIQTNIQEFEVQFEILFTNKLLPGENGKFKYFEVV